MTQIDGMSDDELDTLVKEKLVPKMTWLPEDIRKTASSSTVGESSTSSPGTTKPAAPANSSSAEDVVSKKVDLFLKTSAGFDDGLIKKLRDFGISDFGDLEAILDENDLQGSGIPPVKAKRLGHKDNVRAVSLSAEGRILATGSSDKTAKIWDTSSGACRRTLQGHTDDVWAVSLSADGRTLATGSSDKTAKIWDTSTGACLRTLQRHDYNHWVKAVFLYADGRTLATGIHDKTTKIWDTSTGACLRSLEGHEKDVYGVSLSADGRTLATGSSDNTAKIWDTASGA